MSAYLPAPAPGYRPGPASRLCLLAAGLLMLFAVQPHLASMALPAAHGKAAATGVEQSCAHHEASCPEPADQQAKAGLPCCAAWNCGLLDKAAMPPGELIRRIGYRLAAVTLPTLAGITVEPGERPPRG